MRSAREAAAFPRPPKRSVIELLIGDEADRLKLPELEVLRDLHDRATFGDGVGLALSGLQGIEKRLTRYPQLFSPVGFVPHYRPLGEEELHFVLVHKWAEFGLTFAHDEYTDAEALAAIARITAGNFRLVQWLFRQIARILEINRVRTITEEVIETAREPGDWAVAVSRSMDRLAPSTSERIPPFSVGSYNYVETEVYMTDLIPRCGNLVSRGNSLALSSPMAVCVTGSGWNSPLVWKQSSLTDLTSRPTPRHPIAPLERIEARCQRRADQRIIMPSARWHTPAQQLP